MLVSFVIAFLNEENNLSSAYKQVLSFKPPVDNVEWELILIDDGSTDKSWEIAKEIISKDNRVKGIRLTRNFGAISALMAGIKEAKGDYIFDMAADGQEPIELFSDLLKSNLENGFEISWGVRKSRKDPFLTKLFSTIYYKLVKKFVLENYPKEGLDTFCMSQKVANFVLENYDSTSNLHNLTYWANYEYGKVYYDHKERNSGKSKWTFKKKFNLFLNSFISFTYAPLRFVTIMGLIFFLVGSAWGAHIIYYALVHGYEYSGYASIMSLISFGFGLTILSLGIISEYIWRAFEISKNKPLYIVKEVLTNKIETTENE